MEKTALIQSDSEKKASPELGIEQLYLAHKSKYLSWAKSNYNVDHNSLLDVYQDAIIILYNHIKNNKLDELQSSIEAYLFGITKNLLLKKIKKNKKIDYVEAVDDRYLESVNFNIYSDENDDLNQQKLQKAFAKLGVNCREILTLFYYERYSLESIQNELSYGSTGAVKSRKYQCLKKLKDIFRSMDER